VVDNANTDKVKNDLQNKEENEVEEASIETKEANEPQELEEEENKIVTSANEGHALVHTQILRNSSTKVDSHQNNPFRLGSLAVLSTDHTTGPSGFSWLAIIQVAPPAIFLVG
jgi:hypothetical protein